jgi:hypothetical protein
MEDIQLRNDYEWYWFVWCLAGILLNYFPPKKLKQGESNISISQNLMLSSYSYLLSHVLIFVFFTVQFGGEFVIAGIGTALIALGSLLLMPLFYFLNRVVFNLAKSKKETFVLLSLSLFILSALNTVLLCLSYIDSRSVPLIIIGIFSFYFSVFFFSYRLKLFGLNP